MLSLGAYTHFNKWVRLHHAETTCPKMFVEIEKMSSNRMQNFHFLRAILSSVSIHYLLKVSAISLGFGPTSPSTITLVPNFTHRIFSL